MEVLLDTHVIIWSLTDDERLSKKARELITGDDNIVYYSTASLWELAVKNFKDPVKCPYNEAVIEDLCEKSGFRRLDISSDHIKLLRGLKVKKDRYLGNQDPFDRMLIAQAKACGARLISHDSNFENYDEDCIYMI
ncbi:MAG: type II toxin-antitoxin system VapC family toxin [Eubacteriales bacterium]|nr:type II toxin-antitoxin system VapC family toxin [Eubacteriales bacterium]